MNRSPNTISDEVCRNSVHGRYNPRKAHHKAYVRRKYAKYQGMKIVEDDTLWKEVVGRLYDDQSPEAIAGYSRRGIISPISKNAIYRFMASVYGRQVEAYRLRKRRRRRRRRVHTPGLTSRTFIDRRPLYITTRKRVGDAEADFIVSGKTGKGILLVVVDRKTRAAFLERITKRTICHVHIAFLHIQTRYPEMKTLTMDNDILFAQHQTLAWLLGVRIYFCHPYHAWEKGTVENTNKVIRRDIPKGSTISRYTKRFIERLEAKLNRRPMKCLDYGTPQELLTAHRKRMTLKQKQPSGRVS